ncbi:MAG: O-antigen ligase family protein [Armatimonadetes bacterium]|nr:O-antigen ligase family protein [Armatimonadota bacterium]
MSLARTTIGIGKVLDRLASGSPGRRNVLVTLIILSGFMLIAAALLILLATNPRTPLLILGGSLAAIFMFGLMLVRPEWLLLLGIIFGHTIFYGKFPNSLGMRIKDSVGPGDILFFLAFVAMIVYWVNQRNRPTMPRAMLVLPILLFVYTTVYVIIAFFFWGRQDNALIQAIGWFYFTLAIPTFLCLTSGRIWSSFFTVIFVSLVVGSIFALCVEAGWLSPLIEKMGYGGKSPRSFGDLSVRTNQLGFAVLGTLIGVVVLAFAKNSYWKIISLVGGLGGAFIIFLDRGRASYGGIVVALIIVVAFIPGIPRFRFLLRSATALVTAVLIILAIGGEIGEKFGDAYEKAERAVALTSREAIQADEGITYRMRLLRQAEAIFEQNPLFGGGPGVWFGTTVNRQFETDFIAFIDNSWTYPLAVGGLVGMALILSCYASFVWLTIWAFLRLRNPFHRALCSVPLGHMAWLLVCSPVNWWMVDRFHVAAFSVGVGMVTALVYYEKINGSDTSVIDVGT